MFKYADVARKHILNFRGKKLDKKYVVFESDDWGSERIPSAEGLKQLLSWGIEHKKNPFNNLDSLETGDDLSAMFETLMKFTDPSGNHPVITANSITANPDFGKIRASGYSEYHYESTLQTYSKKKGSEHVFSIIKSGMSEGIYHPQFHGREHLNVRQWLSSLQSGNDLLIKAFNEGIYAIDNDNKYSKRANLTAAFDSNSSMDSLDHVRIIEEGTSMFREIFGFNSSSFIAPCYVWSPSLEKVLCENGINFIQGLPIQYAPAYNGPYRKIYHFQGEKNKLNQVYFVRNCFFEPALNPSFNWVEDCLKRLRIIFFWGKPAIIGTHRINFIGSLNEENRKNNLKMLSLLLKSIIREWPDIEFTSTDKLGDHYINHI